MGVVVKAGAIDRGPGAAVGPAVPDLSGVGGTVVAVGGAVWIASGVTVAATAVFGGRPIAEGDGPGAGCPQALTSETTSTMDGAAGRRLSRSSEHPPPSHESSRAPPIATTRLTRCRTDRGTVAALNCATRDRAGDRSCAGRS